MNLRFCLPRVAGRGAGLGNELIAWARAYVASTVLDAQLLPPAFGLNPRRYGRHFGTPRYDWVAQRALQACLPVVTFDERSFLDHGGESLASAIRSHGAQLGLDRRGRFLWTTEGMWGGYRHILEARDFVRRTLQGSRYAERNRATLRSRLDPAKILVGMHIRLGDFGAPAAVGDYRGRANLSLPREWYLRIGARIRSHFGDQVQFLIVSDGTREQIEDYAAPLDAITTHGIDSSDVSDLLALAECQLLVCSISSYSAWAAFLSDAPYLWFEPNLIHHAPGLYSIWGHEPEQQKPTGATARAIQRYLQGGQPWPCRGVPVGLDGAVPATLLDSLAASPPTWAADGDLVTYGVVPVATDRS